MRQLLVLAITTTLCLTASAEVIRCADAAGNVSYTDGACSAGSKPVGRVSIPEPARPARDGADIPRAAPPQRAPMEAVRPMPEPSGPAVIDSRGAANSNERPADSRWSDRGDDPVVIDNGYGYPGAYRQPQRPRDMRPRIRSCDAQGCQDKQGNHYDRSGQLDRYQSIDGKTCRPVGTTTICR
ncbi:hypothetical protein QTH90_21940 [Variovorax sp. J2P1-59]|uniref:hypothetical protein n=1 Tax=Variovorax flavidus TaxID=3053501 RepID=UPI002575BBF3|nr:hypothetical protein [Variovorax sp. J2P1-59]MDM0077086.1 hypothetical protein [Variovorax sp. J2P1-59]